jgi:hypothetical protein
VEHLWWKEQRTEEDHIIDGETKMKRIKSNRNKKQAGNGNRLSGMEKIVVEAKCCRRRRGRGGDEVHIKVKPVHVYT